MATLHYHHFNPASNIHRPHSTTPATDDQRYYLCPQQPPYHHRYKHSIHHQRASIPKDPFSSSNPADHTLPASPRLPKSNRLPIIRRPPCSTASTPHLTPPSPLIRPSRLSPTTLTRANSLPGKPHRPITPRSITACARIPPSLSKRTHTSPPPPLSRLPTSPTPASAVTGASGLTVSGRMVEYESYHCRREALSKVLRAVSQSGTGRSRHHHRHHHHHHHHHSPGPSPSHTASSGGENDGASVAAGMTSSRSQDGFRRALRPGVARLSSSPTLPTHAGPSSRSPADGEEDEEQQGGFGFGCAHVPPGSQASGYISFASLNLFAPPSPPESVAGFLADDEHDLPSIPTSDRRALIRLRLPPPPSSSSPASR